MNTINNSNTIHWCKDCKHMSLSRCKFGYGDNILPCHILRKLAKKCNAIYNECYKNEDNLINDFFDKIIKWAYNVKYIENQKIEKELILLAMSYVVNAHTGNDLDFINEFSNDIELDDYDRNTVEKLYESICEFQTKIRNEWFSVPENKEHYLNYIKSKISNYD